MHEKITISSKEPFGGDFRITHSGRLPCPCQIYGWRIIGTARHIQLCRIRAEVAEDQPVPLDDVIWESTAAKLQGEGADDLHQQL